MRSKQYWGYDAAFMRKVASLLDFDAVDVAAQEIYAVESAGTLAGFYRLSELDGRPFLEDLWIDPPCIGMGLGERLWKHALERARDLGWSHLLIESDPGAEGFYLRMNARRIGEQRSSTGRMLPLLRIDLVPTLSR